MTQLNMVIGVVALIIIAGVVGLTLAGQADEKAVLTQESPRDTKETTVTPEEPRAETKIESGVTRDLSNQGIREVPRSEFERGDTEILDLSGNKLTSLQAEVRLLSKLRVLDLSDNVLTNIPAELGQLSNLEVLNLRNNSLTGLPYELGNLSNLKTLDLRGNTYATADLEIIKKSLPASTEILID